MIREKLWRVGAAILIMLAVSISSPAQDQASAKSKRAARAEEAATLPAALWHDPGDPATLDLYYGAGGREHVPDPHGTYTFEDEDLKHSSPKIDVVDARGEHWRIKLGAEPRAETAATRLLWAAGYLVDEDYYVDELAVRGLPKLHRGEKYVSEDGMVHGARLERKNLKKLGDWSWFDNPFLDTKELNGLRVMMSLVNNWDLKTENNVIYAGDGERRYVVNDVGATFGNTGNVMARSKSDLQGYVKSKFISRMTGDQVDFVMHERPFLLEVFDVPYYRERTRMQGITMHVPRADAKWLGERLAQLSDSQVRDCFRAAGYSPEEIDGYTKAVEQRIAALDSL
jgi:hypothetical protein